MIICFRHNNAILLSFFIVAIFFQSTAQNTQKKKEINPKTSTIASAIIPGTGQILNGQWYKTPFIYAGLGTCYYFFNTNRLNYLDFKEAYLLRTDNNPLTIDKYDPVNGTAKDRYEKATQLKSLRDYYRRNLELSLIATTGVYILNIIDAYVSAHLRSFDRMDDIGFSTEIIKLPLDGSLFALTGITYKF